MSISPTSKEISECKDKGENSCLLLDKMPPKGQHVQKQARFDIPMHLTTLSSRDWVNRLIGTRGALHKELEASCGCERAAKSCVFVAACLECIVPALCSCTLKLCSDLAKVRFCCY